MYTSSRPVQTDPWLKKTWRRSGRSQHFLRLWLSTAEWVGPEQRPKNTFSRMVAMMFSHSFQVSNSSICLRLCSPSIGNHDVQLTPFKLHPPFVPRGTARGMLKKKLQTAWGGLQPARYERQSPPELDTENRNSIQYWKMYVNGEMFRMLGCHRVPSMRNLFDLCSLLG